MQVQRIPWNKWKRPAEHKREDYKESKINLVVPTLILQISLIKCPSGERSFVSTKSAANIPPAPTTLSFSKRKQMKSRVRDNGFTKHFIWVRVGLVRWKWPQCEKKSQGCLEKRQKAKENRGRRIFLSLTSSPQERVKKQKSQILWLQWICHWVHLQGWKKEAHSESLKY